MTNFMQMWSAEHHLTEENIKKFHIVLMNAEYSDVTDQDIQ